MNRRFLSILVCFLLIAPAALADLNTIPSRDTFSMAYDRLQKAISRQKPVDWKVTIEPVAMDGSTEDGMEAVNALISAMELSGVVQCFSEGGLIEATMLSGGRSIGTVGQITQDNRVGINLTGEWLSTDQDMLGEVSAMLELDELGDSMLRFNYDGIRKGNIPFVTALYNQGMALWSLASPYSQDSERLRVPSGATSHAMVYEIDTQGLRSILRNWVDKELSMDGLSLGISGTPLSLGISPEAFDRFVQRVQAFADTVEVTKPIKLSTTFGEGDVLRTAKGSGTISEDGKRTGLSYNYSCSLSNTRITRKYSIDFQPQGMDTLVLRATFLTSSNNKTSGAKEVSLTASGVYDGQPYRIKVNSEMVNKYAEDDGGMLTEVITGTIKASVEYAGETVANVTVKRNGETMSYPGLTKAVSIHEEYDTKIENSDRLLFEGLVTLGYEVEDGPETMPDILEKAQKLEEMDLMLVQTLRATLSDVLANATQQLAQAIPVSAMGALVTPY